MADMPYIKLFLDDYEAATAHLSLEEDGAYNRLLRLCWRQTDCTIPDDEAWIRRMLRCDQATFDRAVKPVLSEFFSVSRGRLFQKRLREEFEAGKLLREAKRTAGKLGGKAKSTKTKDNPPSTASIVPQANSKQEDKQTAGESLATIAIATAIATAKEDTTPTPSMDAPAKGGAERRDDDLFDFVAQRLEALVKAGDHPAAVNPNISPIWQLVKQGWDFKTEIEPVIRSTVARTKRGTIRDWRYFVDAITRTRENKPPPPARLDVTADVWSTRLTFARDNRTWDAKKWGPYPNQPGCLAPAALVQPDDGKGWTDWKGAA